MEFSLGFRFLGFAVMAGLILVVLYFELKVVDRKKSARAEARAARDELYNLVVTTEAIADSMQNRGLDVQEAEILAKRARIAYEARDTLKARTLCLEARKLLAEARMPSSDQEANTVFTSSADPTPEIDEEKRELPDDNSLPSSFLIGCTRSELQAYEGPGKEEISAWLEQAESAAEAADFDRALSLANKARCLMIGGGACDDDLLDSAELKDCSECFQSPQANDVFCSRCGNRLR